MRKSSKRIAPLRNVFDDDMSLAEVMGMPGVSDEVAVQMLLTGISTHREVDAYRQLQLDRIARGREGAKAREDRLPHDTLLEIVSVLAEAKGLTGWSPRAAAARLKPFVDAELMGRGIAGGVSELTIQRCMRELKKV